MPWPTDVPRARVYPYLQERDRHPEVFCFHLFFNKEEGWSSKILYDPLRSKLRYTLHFSDGHKRQFIPVMVDSMSSIGTDI